MNFGSSIDSNKIVESSEGKANGAVEIGTPQKLTNG